MPNYYRMNKILEETGQAEIFTEEEFDSLAEHSVIEGQREAEDEAERLADQDESY